MTTIQQHYRWTYDPYALVDQLLTGGPAYGPELNNALLANLLIGTDTVALISGMDLAYDADGHLISGTISAMSITIAGKQVVFFSELELDVALARLAPVGTYPLEPGTLYVFSAYDLPDDGGDGVSFSGGGGGDSLTGSELADTLMGLGGDDQIVGYGGHDELYGGLGNDTLQGGDEGGIYDGGDGDDLLQSGKGADAMSGGTGRDTLLGGEGYNSLDGGGGDDSLVGGSIGGLYYGGDGNDLIRGGNGVDIVSGGAGHDTILGGRGADDLRGLDGNDSITGDKGVDHIDGGAGADTIDGGDDYDFLHGLDGADSLIGGNGDDWIVGGRGRDTIDGGNGLDAADYSETNQAVEVRLNGKYFVTVKVGGIAEDQMRGVEAVFGGSKADKLTGDANGNFFAGNGGKDTIDGGTGADSVSYGEKTKAIEVTLNGSSSAVKVKVGGVVEDTLYSIERVYSGSGSDRLTGDSRNNVLSGGAGADTIVGGDGDDHLFGGRGKDVLTGGDFRDHFYFDDMPTNSSADRITDFSGMDTIVLSYSWFHHTGQVNGGQLITGKAARDRSDFLIYDQSTGKLYYDHDANGPDQQILLVTLTDRPPLGIHDFYVL
jgi:Ca2+-binding RTX toxin-like protein